MTVEHKAWLSRASPRFQDAIDITLLVFCDKPGSTFSARYAQRCTVKDVAAV
jgi:hypothetical protein